MTSGALLTSRGVRKATIVPELFVNAISQVKKRNQCEDAALVLLGTRMSVFRLSNGRHDPAETVWRAPMFYERTKA